MNLWIRSQNREQLSKPNKLYVKILNEERYEILSCEGFYVLGTYKTKERALEILDEIQELINEGFGKKYIENPYTKEIDYGWVYSFIYEMPKE